MCVCVCVRACACILLTAEYQVYTGVYTSYAQMMKFKVLSQANCPTNTIFSSHLIVFYIGVVL